MKILITGSCGFIGFNLMKSLLKMNHTIVGIDNLNNYYDISLKLHRNNLFKSKNYLGYEAKISFKDGMKNFQDWYKSYKKKS